MGAAHAAWQRPFNLRGVRQPRHEVRCFTEHSLRLGECSAASQRHAHRTVDASQRYRRLLPRTACETPHARMLWMQRPCALCQSRIFREKPHIGYRRHCHLGLCEHQRHLERAHRLHFGGGVLRRHSRDGGGRGGAEQLRGHLLTRGPRVQLITLPIRAVATDKHHPRVARLASICRMPPAGVVRSTRVLNPSSCASGAPVSAASRTDATSSSSSTTRCERTHTRVSGRVRERESSTSYRPQLASCAVQQRGVHRKRQPCLASAAFAVGCQYTKLQCAVQIGGVHQCALKRRAWAQACSCPPGRGPRLCEPPVVWPILETHRVKLVTQCFDRSSVRARARVLQRAIDALSLASGERA
eukprot:7389687-Prymnesium_polylepis.3